MRVTVKSHGFNDLVREFERLPSKIQKGAAKRAMVRAGNELAATMRPMIPRAKKKNRGYAGSPHYQDVIGVKTGTTKTGAYAVVGPWVRSAPHAVLVEYGTKPRYTRHSSKYRRVEAGTVTRKIARPTKSGRTRTTRFRAAKYSRESIGSVLDPEKLKKGPVKYTGIMPAFRPQHRAYLSMRSRIRAIIVEEMRAGIAKDLFG